MSVLFPCYHLLCYFLDQYVGKFCIQISGALQAAVRTLVNCVKCEIGVTLLYEGTKFLYVARLFTPNS